MLAIDAKNVTKQYKGSQTPALNSISIEVQSGQIFTFLGRNRARKTTFVRMCATQLMPTSGSIGVLGYDTFANQYGDNPVWNNLEFVKAGRVHNLGNLYPWGGPVTAMELSDRVVRAVTSGNTTAPLNRLE